MFRRADFARFRRLSGLERLLFLRAVGLLLLIGLGLQLLGFSRVQSVFRQRATVPNGRFGPVEAAQRARQTAHLVSAAARHGIYRANCLPTSLALRRLLQGQGIEANLRVGVRKAGGKLEAHAWVEHQGQPLIDGPDVHERFAAFSEPVHHGEEAAV